MSSNGGPSTLRPRKQRQQSQSQSQTNDASSSDQRSRSQSRSQRQTQTQPGDDDSRSASASSVNFPGGLPLPAVKGTIGGIESPRRTHGYTSSISSTTIRDDSTPSTPLTASTSKSDSTLRDSKARANDESSSSSPPPPPPPAPPLAVFRADPTVKSCLIDLRLEAKGEIARLFGVA